MFLIIIFLVFRYKKPFNKSRETKSVTRLIPAANEEVYNPDINTKNWDLHKNRLTKFGRSQYKGLTFFLAQKIGFIIFPLKETKFIANIIN